MPAKKLVFDYAIDTKGMATIKVSKLGMVFSSETIRLLQEPKQVLIGIDVKNGYLCVKPFEVGVFGKAFEFCTNEAKKKWIRIKSEPILNKIVEIAQIELDQTTTFIGNYDEENGAFLVDLRQHIN